eukprot:scaffold397968_cov20-Prasinocladus_malaysianus.AAC.1
MGQHNNGQHWVCLMPIILIMKKTQNKQRMNPFQLRLNPEFKTDGNEVATERKHETTTDGPMRMQSSLRRHCKPFCVKGQTTSRRPVPTS